MDGHGVPRSCRAKTGHDRAQAQARVAKYCAIETELHARAASKDFSRPTLDLTARLLRLNPSHYTAWNVRRRCLLAALQPDATAAENDAAAAKTDAAPDTNATAETASAPETAAAPGTDAALPSDLLKPELLFTMPLLMAHPKSYWIWNHRRWTMNRCAELLPRPEARAVWENELALTGQLLARDHRNFHAWDYRHAVVTRLESADLQLLPATAAAASLAQPEFDYTTRMIRLDLSNFSAWHRRASLLLRLLDEKGADPDERRQTLQSELELARDALNVGPEDSSIWTYHRFLLSSLLPPPPSSCASPKHNPAAAASIVPDLPADERAALLRCELAAVREMLQDYDDVKCIYEALVEYALAAAPVVPNSRPELLHWIARLRALDPLRAGRWDDIERALPPPPP